MTIHDPAHPGEIIREFVIEPLGLTITAAAEALGVSRKTLSELLNGRQGVSPEMAKRLEMATGTKAQTWMNLQTQYDLWRVEQRAGELHVKKLVAA